MPAIDAGDVKVNLVPGTDEIDTWLADVDELLTKVSHAIRDYRGTRRGRAEGVLPKTTAGQK